VIAFLTASGVVDRVGVEGAAGYGAGITRALAAAGIAVVEVDRPTRSARRRSGKSDRLDAYHAARAVLAERTSPIKDPASTGCGPYTWPATPRSRPAPPRATR
jgi:transposase